MSALPADASMTPLRWRGCGWVSPNHSANVHITLGLDAAQHSEDKQIELNTLRRSLTAAQSGMLINDEIAGAARGGAELINS